MKIAFITLTLCFTQPPALPTYLRIPRVVVPALAVPHIQPHPCLLAAFNDRQTSIKTWAVSRLALTFLNSM
jgi:hypothetical protein